MSLICVTCGREYDPEAWDPLGGDCAVVRDTETLEVIRPPEDEPDSAAGYLPAKQGE